MHSWEGNAFADRPMTKQIWKKREPTSLIPLSYKNAPDQGKRVSQMDTLWSQPSYSSTYHSPEG